MCVSLVAVTAGLLWHSRIEQFRAVRSQSENLALSLADAAGGSFVMDDTILQSLVERIGADGTAARERGRLDALARFYVTKVPALHGIFIMDGTGELVASALPPNAPRFNYSDREDFKFQAAHRGGGLYIGRAMRSKSDGTMIMTLSRRLLDVRGRFAGMASCTISLSYFDRFYQSVELGKGGIIDLFRDDGSLLLRTPFNPAFVTRNVSKSELFTKYLAHAPSGSFTAKSELDNVRRLFAYRRLPRFPIVLLVAFAEEEAFANWRSDAAITLVVLSIVVFVIAALGVYLGREIRKGQGLETELANLAFHDGLTGLANRRFFDDALDREWRRAARDHSTLSLLMIDVDSFKSFNDTFGHQVGDAALVAIAQSARTCVRRVSDVIARYGGEEFVVLLPMTDAAGALTIAELIRTTVQKNPIVTGTGAPSEITISVGAASAVDTRRDSAAKLIRAADAALYAAKHAGRNQTVVARAIAV